MPIKEGIEYGVNEALTNLRSKPVNTTSDLPLATRINLLKDKDPKRYQENMQRLIQAEKDGNEEARNLLGEIGEDVGRSRRGYEKLSTAMTFAPFIPFAGPVFNAVKSFATNPINIEVAKIFGGNMLQGAFDYALADGTVRAATGKDIMTNVNDNVKHIFGDNKYTDFATKYVTPFAPIPVFGTGNFGKNVITTGKNAVQIAKQYPELLYQIDKVALKALDKTGVGKWILNKDYKWLNRDIPFYNTIMDYKIPKQFREDVVKSLNEYNKKQLERIGLSDKHRDWDFKIIPTSIKEQLNNTFNKDADNFRAAAETFDDRIRYYIEGLDNKWENPMGTMIHEARHTITPSGLKHIQSANMRIVDGVVRGYPDFEHPLFPASYRLASKTNRKSKWYQKLDEFDAELASWRGLDITPYHMMNDSSKARIKRLASKRFGIREDDADFIATQLSINGYKRGGKIKQAE